MIYLFSDMLGATGGIESYLHALILRLREDRLAFRVLVVELIRSPLIDELVAQGIAVVRQRRLPGDRWLLRQRVLLWRLGRRLRPGDWVFCVREPIEALYLGMVRMVHRRGARLAASWMLAPEFLPPRPPYGDDFCRAIRETDAVISVSRGTVRQYRTVYGYEGPVQVVRYHNLPVCDAPLALPPGPPWKIGYMGRLVMGHKNLDALLDAFAGVRRVLADAELHLHGEGPDRAALEAKAGGMNLKDAVFFHGAYDHRRDLRRILAGCHLFTYPSRLEGGPSFALLEILQAGRFCVAAAVGGAGDIYQSRPEIGLLVAPQDTAGITAALIEGIRRVAAGAVDGAQIRARYFEEFDMESAHRDWLAALGLRNP